MQFKGDLGFTVHISQRVLSFFADTKRERDSWFAIIYKYFFEKGRAKVTLLAKNSGETREDRLDKFDLIVPNSLKNMNAKPKRKTSFDSTEHCTKPKRSQSTAVHSHKSKDAMLIFSEPYLSQLCDGATCLSLERVAFVLKKYDLWIAKPKKILNLGMHKYINNGLGAGYDNTQLLNDFAHLSSAHNSVFAHIFEYLGGECHCPLECVPLQRVYRDRLCFRNDAQRTQLYYHYCDVREVNTQQTLDKIHCFYRHSYDLGLRVKKTQLLRIAKNAKKHRKIRTSQMMGKKQKSLDESKEAQLIILCNDNLSDNESESDNGNGSDSGNDSDNDSFEDEWKLLEICGLIQQKRSNLSAVRGAQRMSANKFIHSKVGTPSQRFHYWNKYDDDDNKHWQITAKYSDFKTEMLSNPLYFVSLTQWQILSAKSSAHFAMKRSKKMRPHKYWAQLYGLPSNSNSFNITESHLMAIVLYCNYDSLQRTFADTFYKKDESEESDTELKQRHSNFFHFGRLLRELIECFGKKIYNKNIVFYHGIREDLLFIETSVHFHAPLSTTTKIEVAIAHSDTANNGLLIELMDDDSVLGMARYFDCVWLSDFVGEFEKLFIGGYKPLKIHTILDAVLGRNYKKYLRALRIIDDLMRGYFFDTENEEIRQISLLLLREQIKNYKQLSERGVSHDLLQEIKALNHGTNHSKKQKYLGALSDEMEQNNLNFDKELAEIKEESESLNHSRRISRKISQQFSAHNYASHNKALSTLIDMAEYDYFDETPKYVTRLVDYYCANTVNVCLDWANIGSDTHFADYKKLLCVNDAKYEYEWVKLKAFLTLFPHLQQLSVRNLRLSHLTLKDIHKFLSKAKETHTYCELRRIEIFEVDQTQYAIADCLKDYLERFKDVGWTVTFDPFEDEMCILKLK